MDFFSPKQEAFGLDLSDFSLKIVKLKKGKEQFEVASFGMREVPAGLIKKGVIVREDAVAGIIKEAIAEIKGEKLGTQYAVCSLPEEEAFLKVIRLPKMSKEEIARGIKWQLEPNLPLSLEEVCFDWQELPSQSKENSFVLISALSKKIINSYLSVFKKAGIIPIVFEIESMASARSLLKDGSSPQPVIILDIGASGTGFTIFSGETILFTSHVAVSGMDFNRALAEELNIEIKEAERLKIKVGLPGGFEDNPEISELERKIRNALLPILEKLSSEIQHYIDYYRNYGIIECVPNGIISKILLCGGDSLLYGLPEFLSSKSKLSIEIGNPWINILLESSKKETSQISYKESLGYTVALGLALRSLIEI